MSDGDPGEDFDDELTERPDHDEETDAEQELAAEPPEYANLPDGGALVLRGSSAGSIVDDHFDGAPAAPPLRDRDDALSGAVPLFLCQRSYRYIEREPEVLSVLHANHGEFLALGVVVRLPQNPAVAAAARLDLPVAQVRIADPMGFIPFGDRLTLNPTWPAPVHLARAPYLGLLRGHPSSFATQLLDAQRAAGANLLLTSGRPVDAFDIPGSFAEIADEADELMARIGPGERLALNLTLPTEFTANQGVFDEVLNELSELDQFDVLYVRVQRLAPPDAGAPLADPDALNRLVDLGVWAERQDVSLLHAQAGLVGWLMLGSGAIGFSTGGNTTDWMFKQFAQGGGGGNPAVERHFERAILHPVSAATHAALVAHGDPYQEYPTRWGDAALGATPYDHRMSAPHCLYSVGWLTADSVRASTPRGGWRAGLRGFVHDARSAAQDLGLGGREDPRHLATWTNVV
jgi:hypothetical protein